MMNRNGAALEAGPVGAPPVHSSPALPKKVTSLLPTVEQGCCCCTLPTCCKVQGWMALVGGVLEVLRLLILLVTPSTTEKSTICDDKDSCLNIVETNDTTLTKIISTQTVPKRSHSVPKQDPFSTFAVRLVRCEVR
ncbi:uncharacterized protein LOC113215449 isoform X2 [Frankliniella occidentalis]|uniref:Uncharacterized protein LOC113215449 isoform X1 n=1 Tax=Frankliniella occidentalis TaxID=133901 RepID=A0A9C6XQU0_FRAOC|nr:uncharacterized protein LOC113215449 isoform X1 [Frankliniella occidentalis]XP_052127769.1 uncharacterized protein LOC113215449 isoform X2 [Frankliniella occidentalis]